MKKVCLVILSLLIFQINADNKKEQPIPENQFGIQFSVEKGGGSSFGLCWYKPCFEMGVFTSITWDNAILKNERYVPGVFIGYRTKITPTTYFALGVEYITIFGKIAGTKIDYYHIGSPYLSIEKYLFGNNCMILAWVNPYKFSLYKLHGSGRILKNEVLATGLAFNYMF